MEFGATDGSARLIDAEQGVRDAGALTQERPERSLAWPRELLSAAEFFVCED